MDEFYNTHENKNNNSEWRQDKMTYSFKKKIHWKTYLSIIIITSFINTAVVGGFLYYKFSSDLSKSTASLQNTAAATGFNTSPKSTTNNSGIMKTSSQSEYSTVDIAKKVGPSIVGIRVTVSNSRNSSMGFASSDSQVEGSGIILNKDGYIMTNYHVVQYSDPESSTGASSTMEVFLSDKRQAKAKFVGGDSENDLAVIKVELNNLPAAELGDSSTLQVGEPAIAIGNPLGMEFAGSVTAGVISALNRQVQTDDKTLNLIQTDAAINPGNSGGALLNSKGQVIGINTVKISETGVEGLGFAIPINDAKPIVEQLVQYGYVKGRPLIGISGQEITQVLSQQYKLPQGIYIVNVSPGSGADKAGIKKSDILVSLAGKDVKTMQDLENIKKNYKAGDSVDAVIVSNGVKKTVKLTFTEER